MYLLPCERHSPFNLKTKRTAIESSLPKESKVFQLPCLLRSHILLEDSLQPEYVLDGERFNALEEFYAEVTRIFVNGEPWSENLDALNVLLCGGIREIPGIDSADLETCREFARTTGLF